MIKWSNDFKEKLGGFYSNSDGAENIIYLIVRNAYESIEFTSSPVEDGIYYVGEDELEENLLTREDLILFAEKVEDEKLNMFIDLNGKIEGFKEYLNFLKNGVNDYSIDLPDME